MTDLPGIGASLWTATAPAPPRPALQAATTTDVCVVGAGFTGLTAALALARAGARVVVLDSHEVGAGVSGHTTAKITSLHQLVYAELRGRFGADAARTYAAAQEAGLAQVAAWVDELGIDCAFRRRPALTYAESPDSVDTLQREAAAARDAGLDVQLVHETDLPYPVAAAIRLDDQAELQPRSYLLGLADAVEAAGGVVHEHTMATGLTERGGPVVHTEAGHDVDAGHVVVATLMPFLDRGLFFARLRATRSYAIAVRAVDPVPDGMFISADSPTRSIRAHPAIDGEGELLIIGGEGHMTGEQGDTTAARYRRLAAFAAERFGATDVTHRWSAHDLKSVDGLPYIGKLLPTSSRVLTGTGYRKWGLSNGTVAGLLVADLVRGADNRFARLFDPWRFTPVRSAVGLTAGGVQTARHLVGDRLKGPEGRSLDELAPGEGKLLRLDGELLAAHRDDAGAVHAVSPVCTHLGCRVAFNVAERSWDCPCHGSRYDADGKVLQGPATRPLERRSVPVRTTR
jgi:glycine/D-amino acid oxidase-like deaminating enzyme/nitrite reductase/ring-hydroxylating ferredoxin subunit